MNEEKIKRLIEMAENKMTNMQIAVVLQVKYSAVCAMKRKLRDRGVSVAVTVGRRRKTHPKYVAGILNEDSML